MPHGYGHIVYSDNSEYDGQWKEFCYNGDGVYKDGKTGRIVRALYKNGKEKKVLEVIKKSF
jgi:hypothetical protein